MGITFDRELQRFQFDFGHDGTSDLITLTGSGYKAEAFGKCFYYGYEFEPEIGSEIRTKVIQYVKFSPSILKDENLPHFIQKSHQCQENVAIVSDFICNFAMQTRFSLDFYSQH